MKDEMMSQNHTHTLLPRGGMRLAAAGMFALAVSSVLFAAQPNIKHTMLISGTDLNYVGIVDTNGKIVWKYDEIQSAAGNGQKNDCWLLPNGNVSYSYQWGVRIVDVRTNKVVWDRPTPKRNNQSGETHSCQPLDGGSGKFLVPECFTDTAFIVEVDTAKKELRRIALKNQGGGTHGKWRQIRKTPQNTYLVSSYDLHHSYEYDTTGKLLRDFPAGGYVATRLDNGNTLIGTGEDCRFVEFNASGTQIWEVNNTTAAVSGLGIGFGSEAQRLPNGNTIITNWGGHGTGFGAAVVEIKPDRTVVGAIPSSFPTSIASVKIIDGWSLSSVPVSRNGVDRSFKPGPVVTVVRGGTLICAVPCAGATHIRVFDCNGRTVIGQTVDGPGEYTLRKSFARGVYAVYQRNSRWKKEWSGTVVIK
jgi:hypothetical protein